MQKSFFERGDLIALGPAVDVQTALSFCERDPHAELGALDAGDGDDADVEGVTIEAVDRQNEDGAIFVQAGEVDLSAAGEGGTGGGHQSRSRVRRAARWRAFVSERSAASEEKNSAASFSSWSNCSWMMARLRSSLTRLLAELAPFVASTYL